MNINEYFRSVENELHSSPCLTSLDFHSEIIDTDFGYFKATGVFYDNSKTIFIRVD